MKTSFLKTAKNPWVYLLLFALVFIIMFALYWQQEDTATILPVVTGTLNPKLAYTILPPEDIKPRTYVRSMSPTQIDALAFSPNGEILAVTIPGGLYLYDAQTFTKIKAIETDNWYNRASIRFDNKWIGLSHWSGAGAEIRQLSNGKLIHDFGEKIWGGSGVAFSPNRDWVAFGGEGQVLVHQLSGGFDEIYNFQEPTGSVQDVVFSRDGSLLAAASYYAVDIWQTSDGQLLHTFLDKDGHYVRHLGFNPAGTLLGTVNTVDKIKLWDVSSGDLLITLPGEAKNMAFSPNGELLAVVMKNERDLYGRVQIWDLSEQRLLLTLPGGEPISNWDEISISSLAFSPSGQFLVLGTYGGILTVWDLYARADRTDEE